MTIKRPDTWNAWIAIGTIAAVLLVALGWGASAIAERSAALESIAQLRTESADHETRLRSVERIANDVTWIRKELEGRHDLAPAHRQLTTDN